MNKQGKAKVEYWDKDYELRGNKMFIRLKPKIIQKDTMTIFPNDEYEQIRLEYCPKKPDKFGGCQNWNDGQGSEECCECLYAEWIIC